PPTGGALPKPHPAHLLRPLPPAAGGIGRRCPGLFAARHQSCELPAVLPDEAAQLVGPAGILWCGVFRRGLRHRPHGGVRLYRADPHRRLARLSGMEPGDHGPMKFVILTDTHFVARGRKIYGLDPAERLTAAVEAINRDHRDIAFVIITGDLAHWGED